MTIQNSVRVSLIVFVSVVSAACGGGGGGSEKSATSSSSACQAFKIFNGSECGDADIPVVRVVVNDQAACTGTIIDNDHVLTAAHCFLGRVSTVSIEHDYGTQSATALVTNSLAPLSPNFDIAVVTVPGVATNLGVAPARIQRSRRLAPGDSIKVIGYGFDGTPSLANGNPRGAQLVVNTINDNGIIAFFDQNNAGTCFGDSGGAATLDGRIVGTVGGGSSNCAEGNFNLFTNLQIRGNVEFIQKQAPGVIFE